MRRPPSLIVPAALLGILMGGRLLRMAVVGTEAPRTQVRAVAVLKTIDSNMEFWEVVKAGMHAAAKEFDVDLKIRGPWLESDVLGQMKIMEDVAAEEPEFIILAAADYEALVSSVENAKAKGIRIITLDSGVNSALPECFVATNNVEAGEKAGKQMEGILERGRSVALVNHIKGATTAMEREHGAMKYFTESGAFEVLGVWYTNNFEENAYAIARKLLAERPDLGGFVALNEVSTVGVARALRDLDRGDVKLVGFDNSLFEVKLMEEGWIDATVIQQPFNMGYLAVRAAREAMDGARVERFIDTGSLLITAGNMYLPEIQKILFPFAERETRE